MASHEQPIPSAADMEALGFTPVQISRYDQMSQGYPHSEFAEEPEEWNKLQFLKWRYNHQVITEQFEYQTDLIIPSTVRELTMGEIVATEPEYYPQPEPEFTDPDEHPRIIDTLAKQRKNFETDFMADPLKESFGVVKVEDNINGRIYKRSFKQNLSEISISIFKTEFGAKDGTLIIEKLTPSENLDASYLRRIAVASNGVFEYEVFKILPDGSKEYLPGACTLDKDSKDPINLDYLNDAMRFLTSSAQAYHAMRSAENTINTKSDKE